jgi:hypothetical protein
MKVTVFVPIQMEVSGSEDLQREVHRVLNWVNDTLDCTESDASPKLNVSLVTDSEIIKDE